MKTNTYKVNNSSSSGASLFSILEKVLKFDAVLETGLPVRFVPYILFTTLIGIFYIGNNHFAEKSIRKINRLEVEVEELRADYTSLKAEYMFSGKQSEVAKKVKDIGLKESLAPPYKIVIDKGEH